jgi:hypothetical protein
MKQYKKADIGELNLNIKYNKINEMKRKGEGKQQV